MLHIDENLMLELYKKGLSYRKIADAVGCSHPTIKDRLKRIGVEPRVAKTYPVAEWVTAWNDGLYASDIAKKYNTTEYIVRSRLKKSGLDISSRLKTNVDDAEVVTLYESGLNSNQVADRLDCSGRTIIRVLKRMNVERKSYRQVKNKELKEAPLLDEYVSGVSITDLASRYNCDVTTMYRHIRKSGACIRPSHYYFSYDIDIELVASMYRDGLTISEISERLGVSGGVIRSRLDKADVIRVHPQFGSVKRFKHHGQLVKLGSGWEKHVYSILWKEFGEDFLFQGEFGDRKYKSVNTMLLNRPLNLTAQFSAIKNTYDWTPDFVIPSLNMVIEVKGGWRARQRWNQCVVPCLRATPTIPIEIFEMGVDPYGMRNWSDLKRVLKPIVGPDRWFVYMAKREDGYVYIGCSKDPIRRCTREHGKTKRGARCLRGHNIELIWWAEVEGGKIPAHKLEWRLKRRTKASKMLLVSNSHIGQVLNIHNQRCVVVDFVSH